MSGSQQRRAQNEVAFRSHNEQVAKAAVRILDEDSRISFPLQFTCECANEHCGEKVELSAEEFQQVRHNRRQFIIKPGHDHPDIERIVRRNGYIIVEKYQDPPP